MTDQTNQHGEHEDNVQVEADQEQLETRPQDQVEEDVVKIPKRDFANIKKQLKNANGEAKTYREKLQQYESYGLEADEIEELIALREQGGKGQREEADDSRVDRKELDKQRKKLEQTYQKELERLESEKSSMQQRLETTLIESAARDAIRAEKGVPELLLDQVVKSATLVQNDRGGYDVRVVDENGEPDFNDRGEYMSIHEKVQSLKAHEIFGRAFEATVKQGAGMSSQSGNRKPAPTTTKSALKADRKARNAFIAKNGFEAYNELPE